MARIIARIPFSLAHFSATLFVRSDRQMTQMSPRDCRVTDKQEPRFQRKHGGPSTFDR
jgi:hypothetical protein